MRSSSLPVVTTRLQCISPCASTKQIDLSLIKSVHSFNIVAFSAGGGDIAVFENLCDKKIPFSALKTILKTIFSIDSTRLEFLRCINKTAQPAGF